MLKSSVIELQRQKRCWVRRCEAHVAEDHRAATLQQVQDVASRLPAVLRAHMSLYTPLALQAQLPKEYQELSNHICCGIMGELCTAVDQMRGELDSLLATQRAQSSWSTSSNLTVPRFPLTRAPHVSAPSVSALGLVASSIAAPTVPVQIDPSSSADSIHQ